MYSEHSAAIAAPPRRRRRTILSCLQCRRRKVKCDQKKPCSQCQRSKGVICTYPPDSHRSNPQISHQGVEASQPLRQLGEHNILARDSQIPTSESSIASASTPNSHVSSIPSSSIEPGAVENHARYLKRPTIDSGMSLAESTSEQPMNLPSSIYSPDIERHVITNGTTPDLERRLKPSFLKMKLFGESHWVNQFLQLDKICPFMFTDDSSTHSDQISALKLLLQKCKVLGKAIKSENPLNWLSVPVFKESLPSKEICDELVDNYFRTCESVHRILHIPSFMDGYVEFWNSPQIWDDHCSPFTIKLLLVLAIGTTFCQGSNGVSLRTAARRWVFSAQQWLSAPLEKSRMNLSGLQIQCLLILAREMVGIGSDLIWISAGSLLRSAMQLGYHRDPGHIPGMPVLHAEMRRRLWATIMEMVIQASVDSAMPPLISMDNFDTEPPANINDIDISKQTTSPIISPPLTTFTQTSLQIFLRESLQARIEIAHACTDFRTKLSYDEVLRLGSDISNSGRRIRSYTSSIGPQQLSAFKLNHIDLLLHRSLLALHRPWAMKARTDPKYYYSRKVCLDTSLTEVSFLPSSDYSQILLVGHSIWRETSYLPSITISLELIMQLEEEGLNKPSAMQATRAKAAREPLIKILEDAKVLQKERILKGEMNVKVYLFTATTLAQIQAMEKGENPDLCIVEVARQCLEECYEIFKARAPEHTEQDFENQEWDSNRTGDANDAFNYDFLQDPSLDFDMSDATLFGDQGDYSWL